MPASSGKTADRLLLSLRVFHPWQTECTYVGAFGERLVHAVYLRNNSLCLKIKTLDRFHSRAGRKTVIR